MIRNQQSVGQLVVERPQRSRVFESLGIDYCCGGKLPLEEACRRKGIDPAQVIARIEEAERGGEQARSGQDPAKMGLAELADHIERVHHDFLRTELDRIMHLTAKVADAHGERDPRLAEVHRVFSGFREEMLTHMLKEEQVVFPMIRSLERKEPGEPCGCGSIVDKIAALEADHDDSGSALERMHELTEGYAVAEGFCNTHRAMLDALSNLERDTHAHVHKENNILFVRATELESGTAAGGA
ncbi:MAG: iron-sulfur cluster repair di-iron protein [Phycisphaerales bacterium]